MLFFNGKERYCILNQRDVRTAKHLSRKIQKSNRILLEENKRYFSSKEEKKKNYERKETDRNSRETNQSYSSVGQGSTYRSRNYPTTPSTFLSNGKKNNSEREKKEVRKTPVRIIPLGGLNEIGKNMTVFECSNDMFILDCGLAFPDTDMPGVDIVIPDFSYVEQNADRIRGIVLTHGHEDHIGGLPYLLKKINVPVYGSKLTLGLVEGKLKEHGLFNKVSLNVVEPRKTIKMGCMAVEMIRVNHSIPGAFGMAIHTPAGIIIHTGDFKVDYTPIDDSVIDLARFGELGNRGVLALMTDSTNAERPGFTPSEKVVGTSFEKLFEEANGKRIIIATFSSNIHRIQQIINCAAAHGRKVAVFGRSMVTVMTAAIDLGYLKVPDNILIDIDVMNQYEDERIVLITTGSQGEPMSALTRMAMNEHKKVVITPNDFIIISAKSIPGNEKFVTRVVNSLMKLGAHVVYESMYEVHVSGHACQEELKLIYTLAKPKFYIPVHGEYKHLVKNAELAKKLGCPPENVLIGDIGNVIETDGATMKVVSQVQSGKVLVDGFGVGDVGSIVLRDRKHLSQDGIIIVVVSIDRASGIVVSGPEIISRGFVYVRESEELMDESRQLLGDALSRCSSQELREWNALKTKLRDTLSDYIYEKTKRSPMILPIIMEI